ncbi:macrophage mannose receptor 1-like [Hemibagrus wyckioides]|uniref:macrophage mannose receptor 1-like n=1 Tax=Hemibagrus wyckioides TaxID=337641 RepID=UPI00266D5A79|nr:macrophage mannose receptor 1-like [Hemibagrus wyckioides]
MKAFHSVLLFATLTETAVCLFTRSFVSVNKFFTWVDAQTYCRNKYVDMATIPKLTTFDACITKPCWIGLRKQPQENFFSQWSDESKVQFTSWGYSEPSNLSTSHCVTTIESNWFSSDCAMLLNFICYKWVPRLIMVKEMMTWEEALNYCRTNYSDLVSLSNERDFAAARIMSKNSQTPKVWTGLHFIDHLWFWVNHQPLGNLTSLPSCPIKPFRCGALEAGSEVLENRDCNEKRNFLCYEVID